MKKKELFEYLKSIVINAGKIMISAHDVDSSDNVMQKDGDANFVTVYDVRIQEYLLDEIKKAVPEAYFIAEEKENDSEVLKKEYCFIIDPIDGTTNFIHDCRHSCVSLGLFSFGEAVLGMVYDPYLDELFYAEKGEGAYLNGNPMHVSDRPMSNAILAFGTAPYQKSKYAEKTFRICKELFMVCTDVHRFGSAALDLAHLAAGRNDMFFECILSPWDIAAGALLVTEAGGVISDMNGEPLDLSRKNPVIAANPRIYPEMLKVIRSIKD